MLRAASGSALSTAGCFGSARFLLPHVFACSGLLSSLVSSLSIFFILPSVVTDRTYACCGGAGGTGSAGGAWARVLSEEKCEKGAKWGEEEYKEGHERARTERTMQSGRSRRAQQR